MPVIDTPARLADSAAKLVDAAQTFRAAAARPGAHAAVPDSLASLEEALQALSDACYQLAGDASPGVVSRRAHRGSQAALWPRVDGLSREQEVRLMGALHDVGAAFARCARECREGRTTVAPLIATGHDSERFWFESRVRPPRRAA
jgi:hypothetical protein